jgi:hypothetical protein
MTPNSARSAHSRLPGVNRPGISGDSKPSSQGVGSSSLAGRATFLYQTHALSDSRTKRILPSSPPVCPKVCYSPYPVWTHCRRIPPSARRTSVLSAKIDGCQLLLTRRHAGPTTRSLHADVRLRENWNLAESIARASTIDALPQHNELASTTVFSPRIRTIPRVCSARDPDTPR